MDTIVVAPRQSWHLRRRFRQREENADNSLSYRDDDHHDDDDDYHHDFPVITRTTVTQIATASSRTNTTTATSSTQLQSTQSTAILVTSTSTGSEPRLPTSSTSASGTPSTALLLSATSHQTRFMKDMDMTSSLSGTSTFASAPASAATDSTWKAQVNGSSITQISQHHGHPLSPTAEHALIAAGTVGAIIVVLTVISVVIRFTRPAIWSKLASKLDPRVWSETRWRGSRRPKRTTYNSDLNSPTFAPDKLGNNDAWAQSTASVPTKVLPIATIAELDRAEEERQRKLSDPNSTLEVTPSATRTLQTPSATATFYGINAQQPAPLLWGADAVQLPKQPYNQRISDLSSLSSGFGDAQIDVPESGPSLPGTLRSQHKSLAYRISQNKDTFISRISRRTSNTNVDARNTITSEDRPRFRSVNSWVNQQSRGVFRKREMDVEVGTTPEYAPAGGEAVRFGGGKSGDIDGVRTGRKRPLSEVTNAVFRAHPGEEVVLDDGGRIASVILDSKLQR